MVRKSILGKEQKSGLVNDYIDALGPDNSPKPISCTAVQDSTLNPPYFCECFGNWPDIVFAAHDELHHPVLEFHTLRQYR